MFNKFVQVLCDVDCIWDADCPSYRVFVNDELFTERTWIWREHYLEEMLQINAPPGQYPIRIELIDSSIGELIVKNIRVAEGDARVVDGNILEILP